MGKSQFTNRASSLTSGATANVALSLTVQAGQGARFPALAAGQQFRAVLQAGSADADAREYILVTAVAGDVFTIVRGQEGSAALAWPNGTPIALVGTAGTFAEMVQKAGDDLGGALNEVAEGTIASAGTTNLSTVNANSLAVTGTTTINALGTLPAGAKRQLRFTGVLTITHNAVSLINIAGGNILTAANDIADFQSLGGGNWRMTRYQRAASLGGGATGGNGNQAFYENESHVTADYTVKTGRNAMSAGPMTIDAGVTVSIEPGAFWHII